MAFMLIPEYPPHQRNNACITCLASRRTDKYRPEGEKIIDLGILVDQLVDLDHNEWGGKVAAICETCILELGHMIGMTRDAEVPA